MNKTVELVNEWAAFEEKHPKGSIDDFCRHYLIHQREKENTEALIGGIGPIHTDGLLLRIIGRICKLNMYYAYAAFEGTGLVQMEEFAMLITVEQHKNPKKTEIIYANLQELSSGTDMLNRLLKKGLIDEYTDDDDRRSKRVTLTQAGEKTLAECKQRVGKLARMMLLDMSDDDKKLCIQLLKNVEMKFSSLWLQHKDKTFDEIHAEITGKPTESGRPV